MADKFTIKRNDTSPKIKYDLSLADDQDLTSASVRFIMSDADGAVVVDGVGTVLDLTSEIVAYEWQSGDTEVAGVYNGEFEVTFSDGSIETFPNYGYIRIVIPPDLG